MTLKLSVCRSRPPVPYRANLLHVVFHINETFAVSFRLFVVDFLLAFCEPFFSFFYSLFWAELQPTSGRQQGEEGNW